MKGTETIITLALVLAISVSGCAYTIDVTEGQLSGSAGVANADAGTGTSDSTGFSAPGAEILKSVISAASRFAGLLLPAGLQAQSVPAHTHEDEPE